MHIFFYSFLFGEKMVNLIRFVIPVILSILISGCAGLMGFLADSQSKGVSVSSQIGKNNEDNVAKIDANLSKNNKNSAGKADDLSGRDAIETQHGDVSVTNLNHWQLMIFLVFSLAVGVIFGKLIPTKLQQKTYEMLLKKVIENDIRTESGNSKGNT